MAFAVEGFDALLKLLCFRGHRLCFGKPFALFRFGGVFLFEYLVVFCFECFALLFECSKCFGEGLFGLALYADLLLKLRKLCITSSLRGLGRLLGLCGLLFGMKQTLFGLFELGLRLGKSLFGLFELGLRLGVLRLEGCEFRILAFKLFSFSAFLDQPLRVVVDEFFEFFDPNDRRLGLFEGAGELCILGRAALESFVACGELFFEIVGVGLQFSSALELYVQLFFFLDDLFEGGLGVLKLCVALLLIELQMFELLFGAFGALKGLGDLVALFFLLSLKRGVDLQRILEFSAFFLEAKVLFFPFLGGCFSFGKQLLQFGFERRDLLVLLFELVLDLFSASTKPIPPRLGFRHHSPRVEEEVVRCTERRDG